MSTLKNNFLFLSILSSCFLLHSCASNPTGGTDFVLMGENAEIDLGKEEHTKVITSVPVYTDPDLQAYVDSVGHKLAANSHRPELEYTFTILNSPDINAFALPGGYVYINRGLLALLTTEAQLAAVLGHEIGHVTARHAVRRDAASKTSNVLSNVLVFATGVPGMGETSSLLGGALISGYGRDMELEADGLGAEYLYNAGYEPQAMVEVITLLKNHEDFTKKTSENVSAYHGLFSTHPRNDTRLYQAVSKAGDIEETQQLAEVDPANFRSALSGLPLGQTRQSANTEDRNRYYQTLLNYAIIFPDAWTETETMTTVTASNPDNTASLKIEARRRTQNIEPRLYIRDTLGITGLQKTEELRQYGLIGYTGLLAGTKNRLAVIYYGQRTYIFQSELSAEIEGEAGEEAIEDADELIRAAIASFRPIASNELMIANPVSISYIQADGSITYADLARSSRLPEHAEETLRLMNGDYPSGEPAAGEWIKIAN